MMRAANSGGEATELGLEVRPGGMLVQKRPMDPKTVVVPEVRVRVSYGAARYEVPVAARATFGELKKLLTAETGLHPSEQRLMYRGKVRENKEYLDLCGVKNRSKVVLVEDPTTLEKRYVETRRNAKIESIHRAISGISNEIDKLADQVAPIEKSISSGEKVAEVQITTLVELLMRQAVKLDGIQTDGNTSSHKNIQAKRVQKCVETLDVLKISNSKMKIKPVQKCAETQDVLKVSNSKVKPVQKCVGTEDAVKVSISKVKPVIVTTKWETFEGPNTMQWEIFE